MLSIFKTNIKLALFAGVIILLLSGDGFTAQDSDRGISSTSTIKEIKRKQLKPKTREQVTKTRELHKETRQETTEKTGPETKKDDAPDIRERIRTQEKQVETFSQNELEIMEGLNTLDFELNKARKKARELSTQIMDLEDKIKHLNQERNSLSREIDQNRMYAGNRLKALYKMNMIGRLDAVGRPASVFNFLVEQNSMKRIIASDFSLIEKQALDLQKRASLELNLQREIQAKTGLEARLNDQISMNKKEAEKKEMILKEIRKKKKLSLAAVESLKQAALQLDDRVRTIKKKEPAFNSSFSSQEGRLRFPVSGKIIEQYGPSRTGDYKSFTFQTGIDIRVERGEPVKSVFKGEVIFAQWLKGYGNLLIVNHGENYYTLYAHVEEIFKQKGKIVETGEVIATAGDTGSIKGVCLHFEIRHHGKPVNPMNWLKKGA